MTGEIDEPGTYNFEVVGSFENAEGRQVYTINVNGVVLKVTQISSGDFHTCAVTTSGGAKCWGLASSGQLGNGSASIKELTPVDVSYD